MTEQWGIILALCRGSRRPGRRPTACWRGRSLQATRDSRLPFSALVSNLRESGVPRSHGQPTMAERKTSQHGLRRSGWTHRCPAARIVLGGYTLSGPFLAAARFAATWRWYPSNGFLAQTTRGDRVGAPAESQRIARVAVLPRVLRSGPRSLSKSTSGLCNQLGLGTCERPWRQPRTCPASGCWTRQAHADTQ